MRRIAIGVLVLTFAVLAQSDRSLAQTVPTPRGELRVVDRSPYNWIAISFNVMEHLIELDKDGKLVPRLATGWRWLDERTLEIKLRLGVKFHNGEPFDAEIVKLNWEQNVSLEQPHLGGSFLNFKGGSRVETVDAYTARFVFTEPDGAALVKIGFLHIANRQFYRELGWGEKSW